jgi:hypothetical protein
MSATAVAPALPHEPGFFQRDLPAYAILASFLVLTLPLTLLAAYAPDSQRIRAVLVVYIFVLGVSHFVLTPTIYLQSSNLRYFNGSWRNRIIYFAIPVAIFLFFDLYATFQVAVVYPLAAMAVRAGIRYLDFSHFSRQTRGVLQLYKTRAGIKFPAWTRPTEALYFFALSLLLFTSFVGGGRFALNTAASLIVAVSTGALFVAMAAGFVVAHIRSASRTAILLPLLYFLFQTSAAVLATYNLAFYGVALAMHYVEYHLLMSPRCFKSTLDPGSPTDKVFGMLRANKLVFYSLLFLVALIVTVFTADFSAMLAMLQGLAGRGRQMPSSSLVLFALFDGLFVFHYFVESFIWRFSEPHYRQTLGPLYFGSRPQPAAGSVRVA